MVIFIVERLTDFEYGCRSVVAVFERYEDAEEYIENTGNQREVNFWHGGKTMLYAIEEWEVQ